MRKLAAAAFGFGAAVLISHYLLQYNLLLPLCAFLFCAAFSGLLFRANMRTRIFILCIALSAGFLWSFIYTQAHVQPCRDLHEEIVTVNAVVTDYPVERTPRGYRVDVKIRDKSVLKRATNARLYYYTETELAPGDEINFTAKFYRTDITGDGERYDSMTSKKIFLSGSVSGDIRVLGGGSEALYFPKQIARAVSDKAGEIFPDDVSPFLKALLVGDREELYNDAALGTALSASGIIHIVAVSGMHISFLMGFLSQIIRNKRLFALYAIPVLIVFMAMTGFTPAVTRAGLMQIFLICAPLFKRENDSITSLSAAMLVLLINNPYACASVGLHLSFFATLGIILFTSRLNNAVSDFMREKRLGKKKAAKKLINYATSSLATTFGALVFTLPLTAVHFGHISLISPLTNLLTVGVVSLTFPLGLLAALLGFIHPLIGSAVAFPVIRMARYIIAVAQIFARVPYSVSYTSNAHIMIWLLYVYIMFIALPMLKARLRQYIYPVCIAIMLLFAVILTSSLIPTVPENYVTVLDIGQGLSVAAGFEGHAMLIDCGSLSTGRAGEIAHEYLQNAGYASLDILAVTHFHEDHINGAEYILSAMSVSMLIIPDPEGSYIAEDIIELARRRGTDIIYVYETYAITVGETTIYIYPPLGSGDENERGLTFLIDNGIKTLITGDMNSTIERALLRYADLPELDLLVAGHHGSRESTSEELLNALKPRIAVISSGKNSFGHPHRETLERLHNAGVTVYRTDEMGHVTITN